MSTQPIPVTLAVSRGDEVYSGRPTGRTVYHAEAVGPALGSVLGRGDTPDQAMADWQRRAEADGHPIGEITQARTKPAQCLSLATFCPAPALTIATVRAELAPLGVTLAHRDGEYTVRIKGSPAGHGYSTPDLSDALATGREMAKGGAR